MDQKMKQLSSRRWLEADKEAAGDQMMMMELNH